MPLRKRREPRDSQRMARGSTVKRARPKGKFRPWQILVPVLCGLAGVVLALALGNHLQKKSDEYREELHKNDWLTGDKPVESLPVSVPDIRAVAIKPEGNVGDILIAGKHGGVILPLCGDDGIPLYASKVAGAAGMLVDPAAPDLTDDVARVSKRELNVTAVYTVTCFSTPDPAVATYRRGLDLALLLECAEARPDSILLLGLPSGSDENDRRAATFLTELTELMVGLSDRPAIGVALPPSAFTAQSGTEDGTDTDTPLYAGTLSPARLLTYCDYLAMDLRAMSAVGVTTLLPDIRYAYTRYTLRLLVNMTDREAVDATLEAGYGRVFEMEPPPFVSGGEEEPEPVG